jgi:hypothetical protein
VQVGPSTQPLAVVSNPAFDVPEAASQTMRVWNNEVFTPQSGTTKDNNISMLPTQTSSQNVSFSDQMNEYSYDVLTDMDPTRMLQDKGDAELGNFFSRPIKIIEEEWGTGTQLAFDFDPWGLYFSNPRVANRITNFKLMRANLHLKIVINGNGFQYGRALVSYLPLSDFDELSSNAALIREDLVQASQQPHIFLNPTTSTGGEMTLPFFWHKNYVNIVGAEWTQLGQVFVRSINDLKHANGASDKVTVSVFAWAEDVNLAILTSRDTIALSPQSGREDEVDTANKQGIVSGPATAVAKISNAMAVIPPIAPFAKATSTVASAVAAAAKSLGYCRPPVTANPEPFRNFPTSHLAATNVPDTAQKLSVDDKQELSIDPRIAGLGSEDPLSIKEIAKRESYLTTFSWNIGTAPETLLWNARVSPVTWAESSGAVTAYHFPACCMAAMPFRYWTGSMTFRFQIVASAFHKGRLKFVYDPDYLESNEYNVNYLEIVDIADKQDFSITIGNGQDVTLIDRHRPGLDSATQMYSSTTYTKKEPGNGVLGVYVVNELTTPNSTVSNDIEINVYVSMGDDFEVFVPDDFFQTFVFAPQSGFEPQSGKEPGTNGAIVSESQNTSELDAPQQTQSDSLGPPIQDNALINLVFTGESILSFRTMLKRYNFHRREAPVYGDPDKDAALTWRGTRNMFPFLRGAVKGAVDNTSVDVAYNYVNTLLLHWVTYAFQGWRGSIRTKMLFNNGVVQRITSNAPTVKGCLYVEREPIKSGDNVYNNNYDSLVRFDSRSQAGWSAVFDNVSNDKLNKTGTKGMLYMNEDINPTAEFESPYYSQQRFSPGKRESYTTGIIDSEGYSFVWRGYSTSLSATDFHHAIGEDFQVYFWTGLPRMYYEPSPPAPSLAA